MAASSGAVFAGKHQFGTVAVGPIYDADGNEVEFDVREDEEQHVKLEQIIELLLTAGYFRARIKGLSPFDKIVGGMTWCVSTCSVDIDVDLLFQENSTIGQKISLTEKIVAVLPHMKCPHRIEPHQIQGLDCIHIFPVVQWLVKRAIETREEMGDHIRSYSISQFDRYHSMPEDKVFEEMKKKAVDAVTEVKSVYRPQRRYRRHGAHRLRDEESRVQSTLLEYGRQYGFSRGSPSPKSGETEKGGTESGLGGTGKEGRDGEEERLKEEERRIQSLMKGMTAEVTQGPLTASTVGDLVGRQSEEIKQIASHYADKRDKLELGRSERMGAAEHHTRQAASLRLQIEQQQAKLTQAEKKHVDCERMCEETQNRLAELTEYSAKIDVEVAKLSTLETNENRSVLEQLRTLVAMNEQLKKQEQEFRSQCKSEKQKLDESVARLKQQARTTDDPDEQERNKLIDRQHEVDKEKLHKIRLLLARKNREVSSLQRKIDEIPSRAELSQYQRRFVELYNQVAAKHTETKQFYILYNTLDDTKLYLNKEVNLLNSIHDNFEEAMSSETTKQQFLKQFEQIVESVRQNRVKVGKRKQTEKMKRDQLNDEYLNLIEKQRLYFKTVKDFQEECRRNEILQARVQSHG